MTFSSITPGTNCATRCKRPDLQQRVHVRKQTLMNRILAIIERDLRRFRRSPTLVIVSMVMPLVQLVVLGYAFGGKVKHLQLGVLDQDRRMPAIKLREMAQRGGGQRPDL